MNTLVSAASNESVLELRTMHFQLIQDQWNLGPKLRLAFAYTPLSAQVIAEKLEEDFEVVTSYLDLYIGLTLQNPYPRSSVWQTGYSLDGHDRYRALY
jgi:hypothetical protein